MRSPADDCSTPIARITRRAILQAAGLALASRFTTVAASFFDWLTRMFSTGGDLRFAA